MGLTRPYASGTVALGDLNRDGRLDIVVANAGFDGGWSVGVMLRKGNGPFPAAVDYMPAGSANSVALGDLNGDGKADVVGLNAHSVQVLKSSWP